MEGRALINSPVGCFSEEPACRGSVLPDAASGQNPGTPRQQGHKAVTVQGGYGAVFAVMVQILLRSGAIAVQV